ncbi:MAG: winged helix-turn-helix domain-containing protein [Acidobacteriota bacterium]|jgi:DNA-binding winged helix-turn-helix (wHTH) protein/Tol biopolymer transport system component
MSAYRFGEFVLDLRGRTLHRDGREIEIGARAYGVLELLVDHAGSVVSRTELLDGVWGDVAVTDDSLARAISDLRTALGDDASHPRFIRTVHRKGYVMVAPVAREEAPTEAATERRIRRGHLFLLAAVVLLAAVSVWGLRQRAGDPDRGGGTAGPDFATWNLRALGPAPFISTAIKPAFARSSNLLSVVAPDPRSGAHSIFLLRPDGGEPLQLTRGIEVRGPSPEFTPDDSHLIFTRYRSDLSGMHPDVWLAPVPAGEPTLLVEHASAASFRPDGKVLAYAAVTSAGTSVRVRHEDGREVTVAERGFWPRWSPDGGWIAYTTSDPEGGDGAVHLVRPDGSGHRDLTGDAGQIYGLCWTPDGERVIFASEQAGPSALWSVDVDTGVQTAVTWGPGISSAPTMSADGRQLVFDFDRREWFLYLATEPDGSMREVLREPGVMAAALAPDGGRIALALGAEGQSAAVAVVDVETGRHRTLSGMSASNLAWTADGGYLLVAAAAPDGVSSWIWRLPVGGALPVPVLKGNVYWDDPAASPAGSALAAVRRGARGDELVLRDLERQTERLLATKTSIVAPRWSPDGRQVAWSGAWRPDDLDSGGIWVCPAEGGSPRRLAVDGAWPVWEGDGEHLLFVRFLENEGVWRVPVSGGPPRLVQRPEGEMRHLSFEGLDAGRDGLPLLMILARFTGQLYALEAPGG